jgi:poly(3-hydroxybutyrate) depolymerase
MIYGAYQTAANLSDPVRVFAEHALSVMERWQQSHDAPVMRKMAAYYEQLSLLGFSHQRAAFNIQPVMDSRGQRIPVQESQVLNTDFCHLMKFKKVTSERLPKVLLVAPMSGHFATLLCGTVQTLVQDHEVYLTDWLNIRDIPLSAGAFDLDNYITHIIEFLRHLGPGTHLMGVCQPTVACLAATAVMSEQKDPCTPASMVLMAGPIDTRIHPTQVNTLATEKPFSWFESKLIGMVPFQFKGAGRRVYPGFLQLMAFMNMNLDRHKKSFRDLFDLRVASQDEKANQIRDFYKEYFSIMDLSADFYLQTIDQVFQRHLLPKGELRYRGQLIRPESIRKTFLLTVEGMRDDICGIGQTLAAQDICSKIPPFMKTHHLQAGVGHYGVFSGKRWSQHIYPVVRNLIQSIDGVA